MLDDIEKESTSWCSDEKYQEIFSDWAKLYDEFQINVHAFIQKYGGDKKLKVVCKNDSDFVLGLQILNPV